jgi:selenocysteine lyase/cysteine desulfurase
MGYAFLMTDNEFNLAPDLIYLNHAAVAPWPRRTAEAVKAFAEENAATGAKHYPRWLKTEQALREQLRRLINAGSSAEIALLKNTSEALSIVAYGLDWHPGENVVITSQEFPSNRIVWESLSKYGVETRIADIGPDESPEAAIIGRINGSTRLVSVSSVQYGTGLKLDIERIGAACRERGILFCIDAIQSLGATGFDVQACQADFVMADGHKWMLGPEGIALFYCRAGVMDHLDLKQYGWHMVEDYGNYVRKDWKVANSARRFECGSPNMTGIHALHASLSLIEETGVDSIEQRVLDNSRFMIDYLQQRQHRFALITPGTGSRHAGIVTFRPCHENVQAIFEKLQDKNVICALRGGGIRFSPHFYTPRKYLLMAMELLDS